MSMDPNVAKDVTARRKAEAAVIHNAPAIRVAVIAPAKATAKAEVVTAITVAAATDKAAVVTKVVDTKVAVDTKVVATKVVVTKVAVTKIAAVTKDAAVTKVKNAVGGTDSRTRLHRGLAMKKPNAGAAWSVLIKAADQKVIDVQTNA